MTNRIPTPPDARTVIVGVDTHKHVHVAVAIDSWGIRLRDQAFVADSGGYQALITWAETHGRIDAFGIEGTGSYGAGLARAVRRTGHRVVEVNRGDRRTRRAAGKSDTIDAEVAARSVAAGPTHGDEEFDDRTSPVYRSTIVGFFPEKSRKVFTRPTEVLGGSAPDPVAEGDRPPRARLRETGTGAGSPGRSAGDEGLDRHGGGVRREARPNRRRLFGQR